MFTKKELETFKLSKLHPIAPKSFITKGILTSS